MVNAKSILKDVLKRLAPDAALAAYRRATLDRLRSRNGRRSARDVFTGIYRTNAWGGEAGEYCSGGGSSQEHAKEYAAAIRSLVVARGIRSIVDVGCGDFTVGRQLVSEGVTYVGIDIVDELIERNRRLFSSEGVSFASMDVISEDPPDADLFLIRQVLQHLSNDEIGAVLRRTARYPYVVVTEHYPAPGRARSPNLDKPHGGDTRVLDDSAVVLDKPPFNLAGLELILEVAATPCLVAEGETIRSFLIVNRAPRHDAEVGGRPDAP